ncbi:MAG: calcium/sodium antiporter [Lachnospiraceae bacterium]|nr:calcium/sodium antiporter [Lachnospiraceae bacterium]MBQ6993405.1 calcium/sodium antiporter [Lachnospiraceae bacterium]
MDFLLQLVLLIVGFVMLIKGADWFVEGAAGIARKFGIPQLVVGLTIVAMGTSAPEAAVSITAALKGNAGISIGNVVGSNIMNIFVILGLSAVIIAIAIQESTIKYEIPYLLFISIVFLIMGYTGGTITLLEGIVLWALFILYLAYLFRLAKKGSDEEEEENRSPLFLLLSGIVGAIIIVWGSNITVDSATAIAKMIGLSESFIGLTIVALGTSLPELVTSVTAAKKGNADIAIGNIVGSNIFNILFVIGTTALIIPVPFAANFLIDSAIAIFAAILLWVSVFKAKKLTRTSGIIMLLCYGAYFVYLLMQS